MLKIEQIGCACHTGYRSYFYRTIEGEIGGEKMFELEDVYKKQDEGGGDNDIF